MSNSTTENQTKEVAASGPEPLISLLDILAPELKVVPGGPVLPSDTTASKLWSSTASAPLIFPSHSIEHGINWSLVLLSAVLASVLFATVGACVAVIMWVRRASIGDEELPRFVRDQRVRRKLAKLYNGNTVDGRMGQGQWPKGAGSLIYESPVHKSVPIPQSKKVVNFIQPNSIRSPQMAAIYANDDLTEEYVYYGKGEYGTEDNEPRQKKAIMKTVFTNHSLHAIPF